ncbi:MAG: serine hydrolase [Bacteroidia bacterium]|nr:serine hydrolase [Bacteroidia bacterium]
MLQLIRLRSLVRLNILFFLSFSLLQKSYGQLPALPAPAGIADSLQAIWQDEVNNFNSEGGIIAIYLPGKWYWAGASGNALVNPPTPADTSMSFRVGSLSKSLLAVSLLKLQEQGSLDLDDIIDQWLSPADAALIPNSDQISVRQLLNHKSGIGNYTSSNGFVSTLAIQGLGHVFSPQDLISFGTAQGPSFPPATSWEYSNTNYVVAALLIEAVSGIPYENYIQNNILNPLGLSDSYFPTTDTLPGNFMGSFFDINQSPPKEDFSYLDPSGTFGAGPLASKLTDMINWLEALMEGNVLSPASQTELLTFVNATWPNIDYGLGIGEYNNGTYSAVGHTGAVFNSSNMQYVNGANYYVVYNLTDQEFPHFPFMDRIYDLLNPYLQSCAGFQIGNILGPAERGLNVGGSIPLQAPVQAGLSYEWLKDGNPIPGANSNSYVANQAGNYQVRMINAQACVQLSNEVKVTDCSPYQVQINAVGNTASYCAGTNVQLSAGGSADSINWLNSTGILLANSNTYSFTASQSGPLYLNSTDNIGCRAFDTLNIQIQAQAVSNLGQDQRACQGENFVLTNGTNTDTVNWFDISANLLLANSPDYSFSLQNDFSLISEVRNSCGSDRDTINFSLLLPPSTELGADISACAGTAISLNTGLAGDSVNWFNQNGGLLLANNQSYSFNLQNTGAIISEVINDCGIARDTLSLELVQSPQIDLGIDISVCENSPLNFQTGSAADSVNWYNMSGQLLQENSNSYSLILTTSGNLIAEAINECGVKRDTIFLTAIPLPTVNLGPDFSACVGTNLNFSAGSPGDLVNWFDINGSLLQANSLNYAFSVSNDLSLVAERISSCGIARDTVQITANTIANVNIGADRRICQGEEVLISAGNTSEAIDWKDFNGNILARDTSQIRLLINSDVGIIAELSSTCGTATDTLEITAVALPLVDLGPDTAIVAGERISFSAGQSGDIVNWYDGNGSLLLGNNTNFFINPLDPISIIAEVINPDNCIGRDTIFIDMTTGIERIQDIGLKLSPNPADDRLKLSWESLPVGIWQWEIRSLNGQLLLKGSSQGINTVIDVSGLSEATYLLRIMHSRTQAYQMIQVLH